MQGIDHVDGLVQERHNSIANALKLRLSCTNPSMPCGSHCRAIILVPCHLDGLVQERRDCSALAMELYLSCINPSIYSSLYKSYEVWPPVDFMYGWPIFK